MNKGFTTERESQKKDSDFSFANERREQTRYSAFTLIEAMVAVSVIMLATVGPLYTASRTIVATNNSRDQIKALYLAQEGVEYVRMMRDNEYLSRYSQNDSTASTDAWNDFLNGSDISSIMNCRASACTLDPIPANLISNMGYGNSLASSLGNPPLYLANDGTTNYYTQKSTGNTVQPFVRTVQVVDIPGTTDSPGAPYHEKNIVSIVSWSSHGTQYSETVTDHITPWQ